MTRNSPNWITLRTRPRRQRRRRQRSADKHRPAFASRHCMQRATWPRSALGGRASPKYSTNTYPLITRSASAAQRGGAAALQARRARHAALPSYQRHAATPTHCRAPLGAATEGNGSSAETCTGVDRQFTAASVLRQHIQADLRRQSPAPCAPLLELGQA
eukprot:4527357-Pleurochrysis_carterae.AAC.3